jgi:hypothetical protein
MFSFKTGEKIIEEKRTPTKKKGGSQNKIIKAVQINSKNKSLPSIL